MVRKRKKRISQRTTLIIGAAVGISFIAFLINDPEAINIFGIEGLDSTTLKFSLPSLAIIPTNVIECSAKFTMRALNAAGTELEIKQSSADRGGIEILSITLRNQPVNIANIIKTYEFTPKTQCDDKFKTSGPIGWSIKYPSQLFIGVSYVNPDTGQYTALNTIGIGPKFSYPDLHDNYERILPKIIIDADDIDAELVTKSFTYDSTLRFQMVGTINLADVTSPGVNYAFFPSNANNLVQQYSLISVTKQASAPPPTPQTATQTIDMVSLVRQSDNADLLDWQTKINADSLTSAEASVVITAALLDFRDVNTNEAFPTAKLVCNTVASGGVCSSFQDVTNPKQMTQQSFGGGNIFSTDIEVPQNTQPGVYSIEVNSASRSQKLAYGFLVESFDPSPAPTTCPIGQMGTPPNCVDIVVTVTCTGGKINNPDNPAVCIDPPTAPSCQEQGLMDDPNGGCTDPDSPTPMPIVMITCGPNEESSVDPQGNEICIPTGQNVILDSYFVWIIRAAGDQTNGEANRGTFEVELIPQSILTLTPSGPLALAETEVTSLVDLSKLGTTALSFDKSQFKTKITANLYVDRELVVPNMQATKLPIGNIASSQQLLTLNLLQFQPSDIIEDIRDRTDLTLTTNSAIEVRVVEEGTFQVTAAGVKYNAVIAPMEVNFPFTFTSGIAKPGGPEGCAADEFYNDSEKICQKGGVTCPPNFEYLGGICVPITLPGQCDRGFTGTPPNCTKVVIVNMDCSRFPGTTYDAETQTCVFPPGTTPPPGPNTFVAASCVQGGVTTTVGLFDINCLLSYLITQDQPSSNQVLEAGACSEASGQLCQDQLSILAGSLGLSLGTFTIVILAGIVIFAVIIGLALRRKN